MLEQSVPVVSRTKEMFYGYWLKVYANSNFLTPFQKAFTFFNTLDNVERAVQMDPTLICFNKYVEEMLVKSQTHFSLDFLDSEYFYVVVHLTPKVQDFSKLHQR